MGFRRRHEIDLETVDWAVLREAAVATMQRAYAPYSGFPVGAAGLVADGRIVTGCNVENASYGLTLCAEAGLVSALHAGGGGRLTAVSCVDGAGASLMPCGSCRQLLWEHGGPNCLVDAGGGAPMPLAALLPHAFDATDLRRPGTPAGARPPGASADPGAADAVPADLGRYAGCGTVFVHPDTAGGQAVWTAYWERSSGLGHADEPAGILEEGPTWPDVVAAVRWGRARTPRVVVVDAGGGLAWAGVGERPADYDRQWTS